MFASFAVAQNCPFNCSLHGVCQLGSCTCDSPWQPPNCDSYDLGGLSCPSSSSSLSTMNPGDQFSFSFPAARPLVTLDVSCVGLSLFARFDAPPSPSVYDFAAPDALVVTSGTRVGAWQFVAVAQQQTPIVNVSLFVSCLFVCPNNCSARGTCTNGVCVCSDSSYSGADCSIWIVPLVETSFNFTCGASSAPLLALQLPVLQTRVPALRLTIAGGSGSLIAAHVTKEMGGFFFFFYYSHSQDRTPSRVDYDVLLSSSLDKNSALLSGSDLFSSFWSVALFECSSSSLLFEWSFAPACPNDCHADSLRGECDQQSSLCLCHPPYQLPDCRLFQVFFCFFRSIPFSLSCCTSLHSLCD
jgi:hypothetical protein